MLRDAIVYIPSLVCTMSIYTCIHGLLLVNVSLISGPDTVAIATTDVITLPDPDTSKPTHLRPCMFISALAHSVCTLTFSFSVCIVSVIIQANEKFSSCLPIIMYCLRQFVSLNHVVYKHVTMTTLLWLRIPTRFDITSFLSYGCRTIERRRRICTT